MKVIDLYNKIANGEKVPTKIKVDNKIYIYDVLEHFYKMRDEVDDLLELCTIFSSDVFMNMEVEIMKIDEFPQYENAKDINIQDIEELDIDEDINRIECWTGSKLDLKLGNKINEIIRAVKHLEKTKEDK